jgi:hypothetical protein
LTMTDFSTRVLMSSPFVSGSRLRPFATPGSVLPLPNHQGLNPAGI